jgi:hypothetical protein
VPIVFAIGALLMTLFWLRKKRHQEAQERSYAAAAAAVGLSPDLNSVRNSGEFVNTSLGEINSLARGPASTSASKGAKKGAQSTGEDTARTLKRPDLPRVNPASVAATPIGLTTVKGSGAMGPMDLSAELFQPNFDTAQLGVSMVSAVTEEASVYVELGRIEEAVAVLKDHIELERAYNRATPAPWLMLLELYHRMDSRVDFEALRSDFMKNFNGRIPEWGAFSDNAHDKLLMDHDHIMERLMKYWGSENCHPYIQKLLYDHRDNSRIGFSLTAYRELVMLDAIHSAAFSAGGASGVEIPDQ